MESTEEGPPLKGMVFSKDAYSPGRCETTAEARRARRAARTRVYIYSFSFGRSPQRERRLSLAGRKKNRSCLSSSAWPREFNPPRDDPRLFQIPRACISAGETAAWRERTSKDEEEERRGKNSIRPSSNRHRSLYHRSESVLRSIRATREISRIPTRSIILATRTAAALFAFFFVFIFICRPPPPVPRTGLNK